MTKYLVALLFILSVLSAEAQTYIQGSNLIEVPATTATAAGTTTLTSASKKNQQFTGSTTQSVVLPSATGLQVGRSFYISNQSTGAVTVKYNDGTTATTLLGSSQAYLILEANGTSNGTWDISGGSTLLGIGTFDGQSAAANGATAVGNLIYLQSADATHPGLINTAAQTIAGAKTFSSSVLIANGTAAAPGLAFSGDTNNGLYYVGTDQWALSAGSQAGLEVRKSTGAFANIGMGGSASTSDSYILLMQRACSGVGCYAQVSNTDTGAGSKATWQLAADSGANTGEVSVFTAATTTAAYAGSMVVRPSDSTLRLSLIGGDQAAGYVTTYTGGNYTSAGEAVRINADKSIQSMQQISTPTNPAAGSAKLYQKSDGRFYQLSAAGTERLLGTSDTTGTVTSVAMTVPSLLSISGSPITSSGTLALTYSGTALPVANGGTGLTAGTSGGVLAYTASGTLVSSAALAQYGVVLGGGAGAVPYTVTPSASTTTWLKSGGSSANAAWTAHTAPTISVATTTSHTGGFSADATGTYTAPAGCVGVKFTVTGGGGGGGGAASGSLAAGSGGGGGGSGIKVLAITGGQTLAYTVGAGGAAGADTGTNGGAGSNSTISSGALTITTVTGTGGGAGIGNTGNSTVAGGAGGNATNGDANPSGGDGTDSISGASYAGGNGGGSMWGGGGKGKSNGGGAGSDGAAYGSGAGAGSTASGNRAGGVGKNGVIVAEEYY